MHETQTLTANAGLGGLNDGFVATAAPEARKVQIPLLHRAQKTIHRRDRDAP